MPVLVGCRGCLKAGQGMRPGLSIMSAACGLLCSLEIARLSSQLQGKYVVLFFYPLDFT